jgi:hypothetical protein
MVNNLVYLKSYIVPSGGIIIWTGTIANIPAGWVICDGNNSTPNLLTRFLEGVATAATNPGAAGGATSKSTAGHQHAGGSHQHDQNTWAGGTNNTAGGYLFAMGVQGSPMGVGTGSGSAIPMSSGVQAASAGGTGSNTDSISDIRPLYYDVAYIMKT